MPGLRMEQMRLSNLIGRMEGIASEDDCKLYIGIRFLRLMGIPDDIIAEVVSEEKNIGLSGLKKAYVNVFMKDMEKKGVVLNEEEEESLNEYVETRKKTPFIGEIK